MHAASIHLAWLALLLPLGAALSIALLALNRPAVSARLSIGAILAAFGVSLVLFTQGVEGRTAWTWLSLDDGRVSLVADLGLRLDHLSRLMLLVVTGVASLIHIYSWGYMSEDRSVGRYFAGLS
ncbi:MAG TPA: NADH-quinone oxidoreductase subunit L, partial [Candidatus Paceibacterota bacterium]|nr:NADH-quinone oxidoreductase subunit L [Candidatus Paceibacterota bacterium]